MPWIITAKPRRLSAVQRWRAVNQERIFAWSMGLAGLFLTLALWAAVAVWVA